MQDACARWTLVCQLPVERTRGQEGVLVHAVDADVRVCSASSVHGDAHEPCLTPPGAPAVLDVPRAGARVVANDKDCVVDVRRGCGGIEHTAAVVHEVGIGRDVDYGGANSYGGTQRQLRPAGGDHGVGWG